MPVFASAQEVSISPDLPVRGYFSYDLLGKVDDRIIVYRDRGFNKEIDVYNKELEHVLFTEIMFEKKKIDVFNVLALDSMFQVLYGYFDQDSMNFMMKRYNKGVAMIDSSTIARIHKKDIRKRVTSVVSEDKSKVLLYTMDPLDRFIFLLYDNEKKQVAWNQTVFVNNADLRNDIMDLRVTNKGKVLMVLKDNERFSDSDVMRLLVFNTGGDGYRDFEMDFSSFYRKSYFLDIDNKNERVIICGTFTDKKGKETKGLYFINNKLTELTGAETVYFIDFDESLQNELLHGKKKKSKVFDDLKIKEVINREDGGFVMVSEISREFSRRNSYNNSYATSRSYNGYNRRGWIDYYYDDILMVNINGQNQQEWSEVLYKKQFSQDDDAVYSSFFILKTPSRLRIIFNDEIKKSNTVSEYIMNPAGQIARNSLLSTEYQNMKLRFQDALQLSSNSILVPSEKNYNLNLVRITY